MQFALNEDQLAVRDMARDFAAEKIAPHAIRWDEEKHFPADVMRQAQPGWISARSWAFWRGRLLAQAGLQTPEHPPKRSFHAASL